MGRLQPTPVFLLRKLHGQKSLVGYSPWDHNELDTTAHTHTHVCTHTHAHTHREISIHSHWSSPSCFPCHPQPGIQQIVKDQSASWSTVREKQRCWSGALSFSSCEHWGAALQACQWGSPLNSFQAEESGCAWNLLRVTPGDMDAGSMSGAILRVHSSCPTDSLLSKGQSLVWPVLWSLSDPVGKDQVLESPCLW